MSNSSDTYWAAAEPGQLSETLNNKVYKYYMFCTRFNFCDRWRRAYLSYYGMAESGANTTQINQGGVNGDQFIMRVNHMRSLLNNLLTLTTSQRPALQPKAQNTDSKSMNQTILARSVLDYYMTEKRLEFQLKKATEFGLIAGEGFLAQSWNATTGQIYSVSPTGAPIYDGDIEFRVYHPLDVIRECWVQNASSQTWTVLRDWENKWDLAAKYPELKDQILAVSVSPDYYENFTFFDLDEASDTDLIPVYRFYHAPTEALPNGRQMEFLSPDLYLTDGPLAYKNIPVYRLAPSDWHGSPFGYTVAYDLMGLQKAYDSLFSIITTNQLNYGTQNILIPRGQELNVTALAQGLNAFEYDPAGGEPKALNLVQTPAEIFNQLDRIQSQMETLSGVNSVARGDPATSLHSGAALALIAAQAVQFNNGLQQSYNRLMEDVGTGLIEILQEYAATPRIASIAGRSNRARVKEFKGEDLKGINRVTVETTNPISKTAAGRLQQAQDLLQQGLITNPQHYFEVITTGTIDSMYEHEVSQIILIRSENEDLQEGKLPTALLTDRHVEHINEHAGCLNSPESRNDPKIAEVVQAHMQQHIELLRNTNPQLLILLKQEPLQDMPVPPPAQADGAGVAGSVPPPSGSADSSLPATEDPTTPLMQEAGAVNPAAMPGLPKGAPPETVEAYAKMNTLTQ